MDPVTLKEARKGIGRSGGYVMVTPEGQVVGGSAINPNWEKWQDRLIYNYRTSSPPSTTPMYNEFKGTVATDSMFFVRGGKGRWGFHVFEGYGAEDDKRLTMLAGRFEDVASIYYFKPTLSGGGSENYRWLQLGSDEPRSGIFVTHRAAKSHVPFEWSTPRVIHRDVDDDNIEITGGTSFGRSRDGAALILAGGKHTSIPGHAYIYYGSRVEDIPDTEFRVRRMSDSGDFDALKLNYHGDLEVGRALCPGRVNDLPSTEFIPEGALIYDQSESKLKVNIQGVWRTVVVE